MINGKYILNKVNFPKKLLVLFTILLTLLTLRFGFYYHNISNLSNGQVVDFHAALLSEPQITGLYQRFSVNHPSGGKIFITTTNYPLFHYAQTLHVVGKVEKRALNNKKVITAMFLPKIEAVQKPQNLQGNNLFENVLAVVSVIRQNIIFLFEKNLPPLYSSLLLGIVFGIKTAMPKEFTESLRMAGVMHVIAASGMNVAMTGAFLSSIFSVLFKRKTAIVLSIMGILFYAVLSGLEPSIMRASIMGILVFSSQIIGRQNMAFYFLLTAGFVMLFISPDLISDIGFQLSFVSTLGLLFIKPIFEKQKQFKKIVSRFIMGEDIATTISAQMSTLPILLTNFGSYSFLSIIVNGLVLWTIPFIMIFGGIGAIIGIVFEPLGRLFIYLSLPLLLYFEKIVNLFAGFGGVISFKEFPFQFTVSYYLLIVSFLIIVKRRS